MGEAKRKREAAAGQAQVIRPHWCTHPVTEVCSRGKEKRYCCDPDAYDHLEADFGTSAWCQGGYIDWVGEPLDPHLCRAAVDHGVDPHAVFDDPELNYKPHKTWWEDHVRETVPIVAARLKGS